MKIIQLNNDNTVNKGQIQENQQKQQPLNQVEKSDKEQIIKQTTKLQKESNPKVPSILPIQILPQFNPTK